MVHQKVNSNKNGSFKKALGIELKIMCIHGILIAKKKHI
jgi:hypothetical protein